MHLLYRGADGRFDHKLFVQNVPRYAILSHRWVSEEPTFQDISQGTGEQKKGYQKVEFCHQQAKKDGLDYFWVDTVCIDKTSGMELTEALNSMFRWYQNAEKCYVYMEHVSPTGLGLRESEWFTRGWTLQELIAPRTVEFYTSHGTLVGTKKNLEQDISEITGIPRDGLDAKNLLKFSVTEKLSWADNRATLRPEDKAYCLLGIVGIFMTPIYGEGNHAFDRLKRHIRLQMEEQHKPLLTMPLTPPTTPPTSPPAETGPTTGEFHQSIKNVLYNKDVQDRHKDGKETNPSTWLFNHESFQIWEGVNAIYAEKNCLITLRGSFGTGKSVLLKEARRRAENQGLLVLYHHFDRHPQDTAKGSFDHMQELCSAVLYQLLEKSSSGSWPFLKTWGKLLLARPGEVPWSVRQLQDAIRDVIVGYKDEKAGIRVYIDALEHTFFDANGAIVARSSILDFISSLLRSAREAKIDLRVCIARHHYPSFDEIEPQTLEIIIEDHNTMDLKAFIVDKMKGVPDAGLRCIVNNELVRRCGNDFLWATEMTDSVLSKVLSTKEEQLLKSVEELPDTHKKEYIRIFSAIGFLDQPDTLRILQLVSGSRRSLNVDEFRHAFAFSNEFLLDKIKDWERSDPCFQNGKRFASFLSRESRGLVRVYHDKTSGTIVRFTHGSVNTFLRNSSNCLPGSGTPWIEHCQLFLLETCFRSLSFSSLREPEASSFIGYASTNWIYHSQRSKDFSKGQTYLPDFINRKCSSAKAKRIIERQITALKESCEPFRGDLDVPEILLVLFASTGCTGLLKSHLSSCSVCHGACSPFDERFRNAIHNALTGCWTETAMFLLTMPTELSTGIDIRHKDGMNLLYRAIFFGQTEVVEFLLSHNADPLARCPAEDSEFALHLAIDIAAKDIVTLLLQHGQKEEQFQLRRHGLDYPGSTALHRALRSERSKEDKLTILRLLLEMAPIGISVLELQDYQGMSVRALAQQMVSDGCPDADDLLEIIEDFEHNG